MSKRLDGWSLARVPWVLPDRSRSSNGCVLIDADKKECFGPCISWQVGMIVMRSRGLKK